MTHGEAEYIVAWLDRYFRGVNTYEDTRKALADAPRWLRLALAAFVPTCPKCGKTYRLVLIDDQRVSCIKSAGGCGQEFPIEVLTDFTDLFKEQKVGRG